MRVYDDNSFSIGRTPLVRLNRVTGGAAVAVAVRLGQQPEFAGKTMVVVLPDAAERYFSTALFEGMFDE